MDLKDTIIKQLSAPVKRKGTQDYMTDEEGNIVTSEAAIGMTIVQKAIRRSDKKFIAVGCHFDVEDWLLPDWVFDTNSMTFRMCEGSKKKDQTASLPSTNSSVRTMPSIGRCSVAITI